MKLIILFGPPAVGKMTVGRELGKITGLRLFHNHMTIELLLPFFEFGTPAFERLLILFRREIFKEVAKSELKGLIFTYVWQFELKSEEKYINSVCRIFKKTGSDIYFVELTAAVKERLKRNESSERLEHKPSKRDLKKSREVLLLAEKEHRMNTFEKEFRRKNYLKIDNTNLSPADVAGIIKKEFKL